MRRGAPPVRGRALGRPAQPRRPVGRRAQLVGRRSERRSNDPAHYDPASGRGSVGVEFVTPGISSPWVGAQSGAGELFLSQNPALKYAEITRKGYLVVDLDGERARAEWFHYDDVNALSAPELPARFSRAATAASTFEREA